MDLHAEFRAVLDLGSAFKDASFQAGDQGMGKVACGLPARYSPALYPTATTGRWNVVVGEWMRCCLRRQLAAHNPNGTENFSNASFGDRWGVLIQAAARQEHPRNTEGPYVCP